MLTTLVGYHEKKDAAIANVHGAHLNAAIDDVMLLKMLNEKVDAMRRIDEKHVEFEHVEGEKRVSCLIMSKALHGCVQSALLWHELFSSALLKMGFKLNPCDRCAANSIVEGKQCAVCWHADDAKISHDDPSVVSNITETLEMKFGKIPYARGRKYDFLVMQLTFHEKGHLEIDIKSCIKSVTEDFDGGHALKPSSTPDQSNLFDLDPRSPKIVK